MTHNFTRMFIVMECRDLTDMMMFQLGIPLDTPLELINGGHGLKNPLALDAAPVRPDTDKLPPVR